METTLVIRKSTGAVEMYCEGDIDVDPEIYDTKVVTLTKPQSDALSQGNSLAVNDDKINVLPKEIVPPDTTPTTTTLFKMLLELQDRITILEKK